MTRETKVGAVVAISFLSLVGVVVVSKWRNQGTNPNDDPPGIAQTAPEDSDAKARPQPPEPTPDAKPAPNGGIENARFDQPVLVGDLPNKLPGGEESNNNALPALPMLDPSKLAPVPALSEDEKRKQLAEQIARQNSETPMLPPLPQPIVTQPNPLDKTLDNAAAKIEQAKKNTADAVNQGVNGLDDFFTRVNDKLNKDAAKLEKQANERINQGVNQLDKNAAKMNDKVNGAVQVANDKVNKAANKTNQQLEDLLKQGNAELNKAADKVNSALPPLPPPPAPVGSEKPIENTLPPLPAPVGANPAPPLPAPVTDKDKLPAPISDKDKLPPLPQPVVNNGLPAPPPMSNNAQPAPLPAPLPPVVNSAEPRPMIPAPANNPLGNNPPGNNPLSNNPPAPPVIDAKTSVPPIPAPGSPQVRDSETINYTIKGGETLEAISRAKYGSEKYAKAILAYNRDFSPTGKLLTAVLQPGQSVLLPSADFLEDRYATAIGAGAVAPISINPPIPAPAPMPTPTPGASAAVAGKTYRVPAQGQFLFEIAIRTLGDGNRWSEIYRLNPNINPQQPIPGGTELRLPANAKLP